MATSCRSVPPGAAPDPEDARSGSRPAGFRSRRQLARLVAVVAVLDVAMLVLAVPIAVSLRFGPGNWTPEGVEWLTGHPVVDFGWVVPLWFGTLVVQDAYARRRFGQGGDDFRALLKGSLAAALVTSVAAYLVNYDMSRGYYLLVYLVGTALLLAERFAVARVVARLRARDLLMHRVVAVGGEAEIRRLTAVLSRRRDLGYEIVGTCVPDGAHPADGAGCADQGVRMCRELGADTLMILGGASTSSADLRRVGWELADSDVDLVVVPSLLDVAGPRIHMRPVSGLPLLHIEPPQVDRAMTWQKALFDRTAALLLLVLLLPLLLAVTLAVKLETGGPVLFRHRRVGLGGAEFDVWKFRTMVSDAEDRHAELLAAHGRGPLLFKLAADPRVTRVGRFLRRYSLDELPQLVNVLLGDMSLVGPRPQVPEEVARYEESAHRRLLVRPGMTGLWQVSGRSDLTWEESVRLDLSYVDNWSMAGDLVILAKTVRAVLRPEGAY